MLSLSIKEFLIEFCKLRKDDQKDVLELFSTYEEGTFEETIDTIIEIIEQPVLIKKTFQPCGK